MKLQYPFTYSRTVHLSDTDAAGVVYFARLMSMCHEAYEESLIAAGVTLKSFFYDTTAVPIVRAEMNYFRPLYSGDRLLIELIPNQLSDNEFEVAYQILRASSPEKAVAKASTRHVCIDASTRQRVPLPDLVGQWLASNR